MRGPKKIHWISVRLWKYNQAADLHQQVFSYVDEIGQLTSNIFIPYENPLPESPFVGFDNWVFSTWDRMLWWWCHASLNRIPGRILPPAHTKNWELISNTQIWIRKPNNIPGKLSIPGLIHINSMEKNGLFQFNTINHPYFLPKWWQLLNIDWKDSYGNVLANIDWIQWLVTGDITRIMRVDNSE